MLVAEGMGTGRGYKSMNHFKAIPHEEVEQKTVAAWLRLHRICFIHVPNGGKRGKAEAGIFKALGVSAGFPDLLILDPPPNAPGRAGMAIEMKRVKGGTVSPEQKEWLAALEQRNWITQVCKGATEAIKTLEIFGYGNQKNRRLQNEML